MFAKRTWRGWAIWEAIWAVALCLISCTAHALSEAPARALPALRDGATVAGPGLFQHDGTLHVEGAVVLRNLDLDLRGPIVVAAHAHFTLDHVRLRISDPPDAPNGASGLTCLGPATITIRNSSMEPVGSAHPMWSLEGQLRVDGFRTLNSEFHLKHAIARLNRLNIFELEASQASQLTAKDLDLVFLSTHTTDRENLTFSDIPTAEAFSRRLRLGSGSFADLKDARVQIFLVYVQGQSTVELTNMGRVQLAMLATCSGTMSLPSGRLGTANQPAEFPEARASDCPFRFSLRNVNVDSWDVYASGNADLKFTDSVIDELTASSQAKVEASHSSLYADWLALSDDARLAVSDSIVGSLRLAAGRPDLATSQVRMTGQSRATFTRDRFDCGIYAGDSAEATLIAPLTPPRYERQVGSGRIRHQSVPFTSRK